MVLRINSVEPAMASCLEVDCEPLIWSKQL